MKKITNATFNHPNGTSQRVFTNGLVANGLIGIFYGSQHGASQSVYLALVDLDESVELNIIEA